MKKIIILIPVFNDWESLKKLLSEIDKNIEEIKDFEFECLIVNDASTIVKPNLTKPKNVKSLNILNMRENKGHARCNAFGIRYVNQEESFDYLILMDGDGEDRPVEIKDLIETVRKKPQYSIVAKRIKRSEGKFFQFLYAGHKFLTYFFTGQKVNFGNYSCLTQKDVTTLSIEPSLWSSYSGTVKKKLKNLNEIYSTRGLRYFGPSQMSLFKLIIHSFSIIAVFKYQVFLRSIFACLLLFFSVNFVGLISYFLIFSIIIFNLIILFVSFREKKDDLLQSHNNLANKEKITH